MIPESILSFFHAGKSLPFRSMTLFNFLLEAALAGSVLIIVLLILRRVFRGQIGSRLVYLAWVLVAIRLLTPLAIPNPLMDEFRPTYSTDAEARPVADQIRVRYDDVMSDISFGLYVAAEESDSQFLHSLSTLIHELDTYTSYGWFGKAYLLFYAAGVLIAAAVFAARHGRFKRRLKRGTVGTLEDEQLALYQALCDKLGIKRLPVIFVDPLPSPCLVGVFRPVITLPLTLPPESLSEALAHELNHYKARDPWWMLLMCVCLAVHWFNPLVWIAARYARLDCELACDERVAAGLTQEERLHYADTLVKAAKQAYAPRAGVLATGMTVTGKRLKMRVSAIVQMKAVKKVAATLVALTLTVLTVAAFSTAESAEQMKRFTTDQSVYAFAVNDMYPAPENAVGEPVAMTQLLSAAEAEAQAKRYLAALYPDDQAAIETHYRYHVRVFGETGWEIVVWPPEGGDMHLFYMELDSLGRLVSIHGTNMTFNGDERAIKPSILPGNLNDVLLEYARQVSHAVLQGAMPERAVIVSDVENAQGRYVTWNLINAESGFADFRMTARIAPSFRLEGVYNNAAMVAAETVRNPVIEKGVQTLTYSKDASITFDAVFLGQTDNQFTVSEGATLTVQQAFDIAVQTMLEKSGLTKEAFLALDPEYGYHDKVHYQGYNSTWRFIWRVDQEDSNRYYVGLTDSLASPDVFISKPGEGVG